MIAHDRDSAEANPPRFVLPYFASRRRGLRSFGNSQFFLFQVLGLLKRSA